MKTFYAKQKDIVRKWYLVDATNKTMGKLAVKIATVLRGKHKAIYTPNVDTGDFVIVINARKVKFTGRKLEQKKYSRYSGYVSGLRQVPLKVMLEKKPAQVVYLAVRRMLPKGSLGVKMLKKLKVYADDKHPHVSQKSEVMEV
ncbi:MAG: 50S ribosomal protein L13 [Candidatus Gygaella obscura]|nr:50S ribosomal protein L13 [Candidatus Gygaella obscura]